MDNAKQRADHLVEKLNAGHTRGTPGELVGRILKGGRTGDPATDAFLRALTEPPKNKPRNSLKGQERSLTDGLTPEGFQGPQQPSL